ncbi:MAG TPA: hypothetical protein VGN97_20585 [Mesorhizobium sp.]|jgi:hypothetical protein|nr:hypothetical protein [Mesorhizobium sp.]
MAIPMTPFLRNALLLDAVATSASALVMIAGAGVLSPWLGLPANLLFWAGIVLVPVVGLLVFALRRSAVPRLIIIDIVALNGLWVAGSVGLLLSGFVEPTILGAAFVLAQAAAVALFAGLQASALSAARQAA